MPGTFDEQSARRIGRVVRRVEGIPVDRRPVPRGGAEAAPVAFVVKITGATRDGSNWRWTYTGQRAAWDGSFGWSGGGESLPLRNLVKAGNGSSGTVSGIKLDEQVTGIEAVPAGTPVDCRIAYAADGAACYVFALPNAPVVDCDAPTQTSPQPTNSTFPAGYM